MSIVRGLRQRSVAAAATIAVGVTSVALAVTPGAALATGVSARTSGLTHSAGSAQPADRAPVWLCKPGMANDPCTRGLSTTVYSPNLHKLSVQKPRAEKNPPIDCFYVYPTVSEEPPGNSDLTIQPDERSVALYQAARYSQECKVYAPMYRQVTVAGIGIGTPPTSPPSQALALSSVEHAFDYYMAHYNHGRGFVLIGHSQGAFELEGLIAKKIDRNPTLRKQLVSTILLGGNVLVKPGQQGVVGGTFKNIPACRSDVQLSCVIAYSSFDQTPPDNTLFGVPGGPAGTPAPPKGDVVLCSNPARLGRGSAVVHPIFPSAPFAASTTPYGFGAVYAGVGLTDPEPPTTWYTLRHAYSARCVHSNGANVLMVKPLDGAQVPKSSPTAQWGLHLIDANIELGDLVRDVRAESRAYELRHK